MDEAELKRRTKHFGLRCLKLADSLPKSNSGRIVANQLGRCGTSVGANYRAACRARSRREFLSKLGVCEEEADESGYWLEMVMDGGMKPNKLVRPLHQEADEITRIITASVITVRSKRSFQNPK